MVAGHNSESGLNRSIFGESPFRDARFPRAMLSRKGESWQEQMPHLATDKSVYETWRVQYNKTHVYME